MRWFFGVVIMISAWEITGNYGWLGSTWPPLSSIFDYLNSRPNLELLLRNAAVTGINATFGLLLGTLIGALLAILGFLIPRLYLGLSTFATFVNALPLIALGPLLIITVGEGATPVAIATLSVFFSFLSPLYPVSTKQPQFSETLRSYLARRAGISFVLFNYRPPFLVCSTV